MFKLLTTDRNAVFELAAPMPKPGDFNPHSKLWHPCCLV